MILPETVMACIAALENAGFRAYAVGGCVRDARLGLVPHDYDLCTDALPEETARVFEEFPLVRSGEKHGTIGVVTDGQVLEITTFRTEGGYQDSRHPDWVRFVSRVEEDLARRDFTVNAMAFSPRTGFIDPFGGQQDLHSRVLRTVGDPAARFTEDPLRILRGVRFAVRFDLEPEAKTEQAMNDLAPLMDKLARERVFDELCKLLPLVKAADLLRYANILTAAVPELKPMVGFLQHNPHHAYDVFTHTAYVTESVEPELHLRWAALLHDAGKPETFALDETGYGHFKGHAGAGARIADSALRTLKAPNALREQVVTLIENHMLELTPDQRLLRRRVGKLGEDTVMDLLRLQKADYSSKGTGGSTELMDQTREMLQQMIRENACLKLKDLAISGQDLIKLGFVPGPALGACLNGLFEKVLDQQLPNEREALLQAALLYK